MTDYRAPTPNEFQQIVIARELAHRPEVRHLARVIYMTATDPVETETPPLYINLAKQLIDDKAKRDQFLVALEMCKR
jgi:hypothetical protein